jgi:hypothetical protein
MPRINVTLRLNVNGVVQPLQRLYVEHIAFGLRVPGSRLYITDDQGRVRDSQQNLGIDAIPNLLDGSIDIRVICHNSVVKIPNGPFDHFKDFKVTDGSIATITAANSPGNFAQFRVLQRCMDVYETSCRQFQVFGGEFPLGKRATLDDTRTSRKRIEVFFPDILPQPLSFVEPKSIHTGYPIIHLKDNDNRLFGANPILVPAELSHALHFSLLSEQQRQDITVQYTSFIVSDVVQGGTGTHSLVRDTDPIVAFVEAFDHFLHRFERFVRQNPTLTGPTLRNDFIRSELTSNTFGTLTGTLSRGTFTPLPAFLTAGARAATSIEGSIYAAIFLDFARKPNVGLRTVVNAFIRSKTLSFGEFRAWILANKPQLTNQINEVKATWTL